jgi:hypothetical protein
MLVDPLEEAVAPWLQVSRNGFDLFLYLPAGWTLSFFFAVPRFFRLFLSEV